MSPDVRTKILVVALLLVLGVGGFAVFTMMSGGANQADNGTTAPPADLNRASANTMPAEPPRVLLDPPAPLTVAPSNANTAGTKDPFVGGPVPPPKPTPPPPPPMIKVVQVPPILPTPDRLEDLRGPKAPPIFQDRTQSVGRHAGWIYSSNGQVVAIFEDNDGNARGVRVGDDLGGGLRVKAITPDYLVVVDEQNPEKGEQKLKLQGLDSYPTKRDVALEATPTVPKWGGR